MKRLFCQCNQKRGIQQESGLDAGQCGKLVKIAHTACNLKGHGLDEGISTRLLVYAARLIKQGIDPHSACRMALAQPISDGADVRDTLNSSIKMYF